MDIAIDELLPELEFFLGFSKDLEEILGSEGDGMLRSLGFSSGGMLRIRSKK